MCLSFLLAFPAEDQSLCLQFIHCAVLFLMQLCLLRERKATLFPWRDIARNCGHKSAAARTWEWSLQPGETSRAAGQEGRRCPSAGKELPPGLWMGGHAASGPRDWSGAGGGIRGAAGQNPVPRAGGKRHGGVLTVDTQSFTGISRPHPLI